MQEETFQLQQNQVIEYTLRKFLKPLQRKSQSKAQDANELYSTLEATLDNPFSNFSKRGTNFQLEEEYNRRSIKNPLANELPNFSQFPYQLNHTIQQQQEISYVPNEMIQNEHFNQNNVDLQQYNDQPFDDSHLDDFKLIQVDDINCLQTTHQSNNIENQTKTSRDKKQISKLNHLDLTKGIYKILIKK